MRTGEQMLRYNYFEEVRKLKLLQRLADEKGTSVSDLIRQAVQRMLDDHTFIVENETDGTAESPDPASS